MLQMIVELILPPMRSITAAVIWNLYFSSACTVNNLFCNSQVFYAAIAILKLYLFRYGGI